MLPAAPRAPLLEGRRVRCQPRAASGSGPPAISSRPSALTAPTSTAATIATTATATTSSCSVGYNVLSLPLAAASRRRTGSGAAGTFVSRTTLGRNGAAGAAAATSSAAADHADAPRVEEPSTALLLAWFACGNRSLFAAQCLVEVVVELYREGRTFGELQLSLKMATQGGRVIRGRRAGSDRDVNVAASEDGGDGGGDDGGDAPGREEEEEGEEVVLPPLLQGQEEDVLASWVALIFLTCEELGVPRDREPAEQHLQRQQQPEMQEQQGQGQGQGGAAPAAAGAAAGAGAGAHGGGSGLGAGVGMGSMAAGSAYLRGMLGYVRQTLGMYDEGQTLARVAGLQGLVQQSAGAASSPFLLLMQQYTRLVLLTVEVVAAARLPTVRPLRPPETVGRPSGYSQAFSGSCNAVLDDGNDGDGGVAGPQSAAASEVCPTRGLAVRLLMAFMGAVLGSQWSLRKFVEAVRVAYDQGVAADELFQQLDEQEFVQSGGLLPIAGTSASSETTQDDAPPSSQAAPSPQYLITKALLSTWISLSYMTLAQLAVPYPEAGQRLGWAWAGFGDPTEALGMNDFVGNVLRQMAGADPRVVPSPPPPPQQQHPSGGSAEDADPVVGADVGGDASASAAPLSTGAAGSRRREGALMMRVEDETLPNTSTAVLVMTQQVALVQAVCRQVMTEGQD